MKRKRPFSITLVALLVLMLAVVNLTRLVLSIQRWEFLAGTLPVSPAYLSVSGLMWAIIWLAAGWGLWRGLPWAPRLALVVTVAYSLYLWIDRLLLPHFTGRNANWLFLLVSNLLILTGLFWAMFRREARAYFGETNDR